MLKVFLKLGGRVLGGPILTFPSWQNTDKVLSEDLKQLILYLANVPRYLLIFLAYKVCCKAIVFKLLDIFA